MDDAKERFELAQTIPDFNKQLSLVSIVGARGVGKSTVTSLLSGNHSMFITGSGVDAAIVVFVHPKLKLPTKDVDQFLTSSHPIPMFIEE